MTERTWYWPDRNPHRRWLEDEFELPPALTRGKDQLHIRIECAQDEDTPPWTEFRYWVFSHGLPWRVTGNSEQ